MTQIRPPKLNAAKHWMTSREPLIPGESREALQAHLEHWNNLYPEVETDELLSDLVREAAFDQWLLFRYQRQYDKTVAILYKIEIDAWPPEHHTTFQLRERYLNSAQRRFNRHRTDIFQYQRNLRSQAREDRIANDYAARAAAKTPATPQPAPPRPEISNDVSVQYISVSKKNGKTNTYFNPSNDVMLQDVAKTHYETALVIRYIEFKDYVVPPEYEAFTERVAKLKGLDKGGGVHLPLSFRSLRIAIDREKEFGGHVREWPDLRAADDELIMEQERKYQEGLKKSLPRASLQ